MAIITNTYTTSGRVGNREELSDYVDRITPEETVIYTMAGKESASSIQPEWEIETLRAPAANAQVEGDQYTYNAQTTPIRVKNPMQILRESWIISKTQDAVDNAGKAEQTAKKRLIAGINLRRDAEFAIVSNTASVATGTRLLGGLPSWLTSNVSRGATGANGGYNTGTGLTVAATNGTQRAFTKTIMDSVLQSARINGGNPKYLVSSSYVKSVFATFMSDANVAPFRMSVDGTGKNILDGSADIYVGQHGRIAIVDNPVMNASAAVARNAFFLEPGKLKVKQLRKFQDDKDVAPNADATAGVIVGELTLKVVNEAAHGVAADLFGLTAST
ncbi:DUF5309 family protein [Paracoccus sp. PAR01]|uniref:SU10 major capsid protein n=1 Tax=Paracoccus sp. PAR01 TaxID=2769282 RepID=UPI0017844B68|nr:DUF5309 family protein [Paracoccus sp. PAR01]MBD9528981.1 DUF5309 family protein [Paracoccus sp. PAR01]